MYCSGDKENEVIKQECLEKVLGSYYEDFHQLFELLDTYGRYKSDDALRTRFLKLLTCNSCVIPVNGREQVMVMIIRNTRILHAKWAKDIIDNLISGVDATVKNI